ncbi:kinase-like protein [Poronia punctata]|nr:kinase-like protein [Poronia punctata]
MLKLALVASPRQSAQPLRAHDAAHDLVVRRDQRCFLTRKKGSFNDPLVVVPIFPDIDKSLLQESEALNGLLEAFLNPELTDWIKSRSSGCIHNSTKDLWLLRKSAAAAFSEGCYKVTPINTFYMVHSNSVGGVLSPPFKHSHMVSPSGLSECSIEMPDHSALEILSCFAEPIRWTHVARALAGLPRYGPRAASLFPTQLRSTLASLLLSAWLHVPVGVRACFYRGLARLGGILYGPSESFNVQRLPFGMYVKMRQKIGHGSLANEYQALKLVRRYTDIPVAQPLDLISDKEDSYLLTSRLPGHMIGPRMDAFTDEKVGTIGQDLQRCIKQLRLIPKLGVYDARVIARAPYDAERGDYHGPFASERDFNDYLKSPHLPDLSHRDSHAIVLAHGDINMRNILVDDDGMLSGIVDWEMAGWYPDYWDYTKAHYVTKRHWRWRKMMDEVFDGIGDFRKELEIEWQLWNYCD